MKTVTHLFIATMLLAGSAVFSVANAQTGGTPQMVGEELVCINGHILPAVCTQGGVENSYVCSCDSSHNDNSSNNTNR